jgi:hypothetical protein
LLFNVALIRLTITEKKKILRKYELGPSTSIVGLNNQKFKLEFNELVEVNFLGEGQFGIVSEMYHEPSGLTFAVKVILINY